MLFKCHQIWHITFGWAKNTEYLNSYWIDIQENFKIKLLPTLYKMLWLCEVFLAKFRLCAIPNFKR